ncbi:MAG: polysaccharide deacetylase family protein [Acidimicrobiia bacterium]|nr:polysaccharide deacetylase family protein [Acidimicrobiia bacterium]
MFWLLAVGFMAFCLSHSAPFPFLLEAFAPGHSLWHVQEEPGQPPTIYLTFDDGPNPTATPALLDVLGDADARATFFLIDAYVHEDTAPIIRRMFEEGHGVALHSDTRMLTFLTPEGLAAQVTRQADRIGQLTGRRPCPLFRPHAGWRGGPMYEGLISIDHRLVGWSWGLWDFNFYLPRDAEGLARRLARKASAGDIIVMHDGHHRNPEASRGYAVDATRLLAPALQARGFRLAPLCEPHAIQEPEGRQAAW